MILNLKKIKEKAFMMFKNFQNKLENVARRESQKQYGTTCLILKTRYLLV
jgi:hypothetical protein